MLVEWLMGGLVNILGILPDFDPLPDISTVISEWYELPVVGDGLVIMSWLDHYAPISEAMTMLGWMVTALGIYLTWYIALWFWSLLRGNPDK